MNQESIARFLEQLSTPKKNMADWPKWMRESTGVAAASLPRVIERSDGDKEQSKLTDPPKD
jgi:hypothetical protein